MSSTLLVDGHVHYHPCFGVAPFLESALANFSSQSERLGRSGTFGCLMFTESAWCHYFELLRDGEVDQSAPRWSVESTDEDESFFATRDDGARLLLVAGRQVVTSDRLEVLALATAQEYDDGLPLREAAEMVVASDAIPVLPWGFGKWTGARGRAVRGLLESALAEDIYVGDNGGRPGLTPEPTLFGVARARGVPVLPGSDPLPIPVEVRKPGRYGFVLEGELDGRRPAADLKGMIRTRAQPRAFGRLESLPAFFVRQTQLRFRRRGPTPRAADTVTEAPRP